MLPYFLGCPSWSENAWREYLYPQDARANDFLGLYSQVFNAVEGNTTFYARPAPTTVQRWAEIMPEHFRFTAKFPGDISHGGDLRQQLSAAETFVQLLSPLGERVSPLWLQLPASFAPQRLAELAGFIDGLQRPLAVEVRHPEFFAKGDAERRLNRLLRERGVERICLDPRALFSCTSSAPAVLHAQSKKPRVPPRPAAFTQFPQVRFIGHPELEANDPFLLPWIDKVATWIEEGRTPYVFLHTSDNRLAAELARRFHARLMQRLPGLPALPELYREPAAEQLGLL
ncbi:PF01904 family protein [Pseudomonas sp. Os17]|nr:PF01904 family protein [Pseudomonas sp. Os17]BAQ79062.1 PF01904 family protein [Pseudomonas sp. St29]